MSQATPINTTILDARTSAEVLAYAEALTAATRHEVAALSARVSRVAGLLDVMPCAVQAGVV